jgi:hypothetical protein
LATAEILDELEREQIEASNLPANWRESPPPLSQSSATILRSEQSAAYCGCPRRWRSQKRIA